MLLNKKLGLVRWETLPLLDTAHLDFNNSWAGFCLINLQLLQQTRLVYRMSWIKQNVPLSTSQTSTATVIYQTHNCSEFIYRNISVITASRTEGISNASQTTNKYLRMVIKSVCATCHFHFYGWLSRNLSSTWPGCISLSQVKIQINK